VVGWLHLQPSWALHNRQQRRNTADEPIADAHHHDRTGHERTDNHGTGHERTDNHGTGHERADHDGPNHDHRANHHPAVTDVDGVAGSEWIVAELATRKDLRQYVIAQRTGHRACWCSRCAGRR
jgi:hypothetical protein